MSIESKIDGELSLNAHNPLVCQIKQCPVRENLIKVSTNDNLYHLYDMEKVGEIIPSPFLIFIQKLMK